MIMKERGKGEDHTINKISSFSIDGKKGTTWKATSVVGLEK